MTDMAESAGILLRVSSDGQDEENQRPELEAHCGQRGYRVNKTYQLYDKSAYKGEHDEALQEILSDIRSGYIKVIVIVHSSRIDRRDPDIAEFYHLSIKMAGGRIESVREPMFGKSDVSGRVITMLAQNANHDYSKTLGGHVRAGHNRIRKNQATNGTGLFGHAHFGYTLTGEKYEKTLEIDWNLSYSDASEPDGRMHYVKAMFIRIADGWSLRRVAEWLNAEHVPTVCKTNNRRQPAKGEWTASTVSQKIRNTVYKGQVRDSAHNFVRTCDPIVNSTLWRKANDRLDSAPTRRGKQNKANSAMLTSVLFCAGCGSPMYKSTSETQVYYRCAGKANGRSCCMIRMAAIDGTVNAIMGQFSEPVTELVLIPGHNYEDELDLIKAQIKALDVDGPGYDEQHAALMAERARLKSLDTVPDEWLPRPVRDAQGNIVTHASRWAAFSTRERGEWLQAKEFTIWASRAEVTVRQGDASATLPL